MRNGNSQTKNNEKIRNTEQDTINLIYLPSNYTLNRKSFLYLLSETCLFSLHYVVTSLLFTISQEPPNVTESKYYFQSVLESMYGNILFVVTDI